MDKQTQSATILSFEWKLFYNSFSLSADAEDASAQTPPISFNNCLYNIPSNNTRTMKSIYGALSNNSKISSLKSFYTHLRFDRWSGWLDATWFTQLTVLKGTRTGAHIKYSINLKKFFVCKLKTMKNYFNRNAFGVQMD